METSFERCLLTEMSTVVYIISPLYSFGHSLNQSQATPRSQLLWVYHYPWATLSYSELITTGILLGYRLIGIPIPVCLYDELSTLDYTLLYIVYIYRSLFPTHVAASHTMCSLSLLGSCSKPTSVEDPYPGPLYISCSTCTTLTPTYVLAIRR